MGDRFEDYGLAMATDTDLVILEAILLGQANGL